MKLINGPNTHSDGKSNHKNIILTNLMRKFNVKFK